jgi:hypothetical protein
MSLVFTELLLASAPTLAQYVGSAMVLLAVAYTLYTQWAQTMNLGSEDRNTSAGENDMRPSVNGLDSSDKGPFSSSMPLPSLKEAMLSRASHSDADKFRSRRFQSAPMLFAPAPQTLTEKCFGDKSGMFRASGA